MKSPPTALYRGPFYSGYSNAGPEIHEAYLEPIINRVVAEEANREKDFRIFDLGAGIGFRMRKLVEAGYEVVGVEPSESGVAVARAAAPGLKIYRGSSEEDLAATYGTFSMVISLEVIEHVYLPRQFAASIFSLLRPGGLALVSTPYHGYWKNLALAITGKTDSHFTALWDGGHIKFWSISTLGKLLRDTGFDPVTFERLGRIPTLAKSMVALARKPERI